MKRFALLLFSLPVFAQGLTMSLNCPVQAKSGTQVTCSIVSTGSSLSTELDGQVSLLAGTTPVSWTILSSLTSKTAQANPANGIFTLTGLNQTPITSSNVAAITFTMPSSPVTYSITMGAAVDAQGGVLTVTVNPSQSIAVVSSCDENGDGTVNAADAGIAVQNILNGPATQTALQVNLSNEQKDVNAISGTCTR